MKKRAESQRKLDHDIDKIALDNGIKLADNSINRRKQEMAEQSRKNK